MSVTEERLARLEKENQELHARLAEAKRAGPAHFGPKRQGGMDKSHEVLFSPITIGKLQIKNRYVMTAMGAAGLCDSNGAYNERGVEYYVARARGGTGLLITGVTRVENEVERMHTIIPNVTVSPRSFLQSGRQMTERIHAHGSRIFLQLGAGFGRVILPNLALDFKPIAPSAIPHRWRPEVTCREMTIDEIHKIVSKFAEASVIAQQSGFDGVEIHAVHEGYLLDQFAISMFNQRTDQYGGSLENRLRFAVEIVQAIKAACGQDFPVGLRFSLKSFIKDWLVGAVPGEEFEEKGRDIAEGIEAAKLLEAAGYDMFDVDVGSYDSWYWSHPPMYHGKGMFLPFSEIMKQHVRVPIITAGRMDDPTLAADAIVSGKTDMVGLARPLLADPDLPNKIRMGKPEAVRPCISCQEGCIGRLASFSMISCAVNPSCAREAAYALTPAMEKLRVMIVGGGIGGLEAARVCALRGHSVDLYEKTERLGGLLIPGGVPSFKEDEHNLVAWYEREIAAKGVRLHMGVEVDEKIIFAEDPDAVVFATGSRPRLLDLGVKNVFTAEDVLNGVDPGARVIVAGGGTTGCEAALHLHELGKKVTIVEEQEVILKRGAPLCHANKSMLEDLIHFNKIDVITSARVVAAAEGGFVLQSKDGSKNVLEADSVVLSIGSIPEKIIYEKVHNKLRGQTFLIGDANGVSNIMKAIWDAYEISRLL